MGEILKIKFEKTFGVFLSTVLLIPSTIVTFALGVATNNIEFNFSTFNILFCVFIVTTWISLFFRLKYKEYEKKFHEKKRS